MPATVTLSTTTLLTELKPSDSLVRVASTSGLIADVHLFLNGELMRVVSPDVASSGVYVYRGVGGTSAVRHDPGAVIYIGAADQFYSTDPVGSPPEAIPVSPWINIQSGAIWFAQGSATSDEPRWWQKQAVVPEVGALGILGFSYEPTSST
jgi:hypothetical protein